MEGYIKPNKTTRRVHHQIIIICGYLRTDYKSKKHGGCNIYEDEKVYMCTDTYVPNVDLYVKLPDRAKERVFGFSYSGDFATYHSGKWESYIKALYDRAMKIKSQKDAENKAKREAEAANAPASSEAEKIFDD